jgi:hypothetical protein
VVAGLGNDDSAVGMGDQYGWPSPRDIRRGLLIRDTERAKQQPKRVSPAGQPRSISDKVLALPAIPSS